MAVVRSPRSSPPYALILFIFLFVAAGGLAGYLFVQNGKIAKDHADLVASDSDVFLNTSERGSAAVRDLIATGHKDKRGAMAIAVNQIGQLKGRIAVDGANLSYDEILTKIDAARNDVNQRDTALLSALDALNKTGQTAASLAAERKTALDNLEAQLTAAKKTYDESVTAAVKNVEDRKADIDKLNSQLADLRAANDANVKKYEAEKTKLLADQDTAQRELVVKIQQAQDENTRLQGQIRQFRDRLNLLSPGAKTLLADEADGSIIRASTQTGEVWINLGRKDHITPGLTFAVYDPHTGVHTSTDEAAKGKGGIEVTEVGENQSTCRITRMDKNQTFQVNDLIANPVYNKDKNRKYHFVVFGDFDLDNDGLATPAEKEKIVHLIQSWGGVIDDKVSTQTDFVVVGSMPPSVASNFSAQTEQTADTVKARKEQQDQYNQIVSSAKDYSIPVLNANRFLAMIGYYSTTVVRY